MLYHEEIKVRLNQCLIVVPFTIDNTIFDQRGNGKYFRIHLIFRIIHIIVPDNKS